MRTLGIGAVCGTLGSAVTIAIITIWPSLASNYVVGGVVGAVAAVAGIVWNGRK